MTPPIAPRSPELRRWLTAVFIVFFLLGITWGALLTRFPTLRDELGFSVSMMSAVVLFPSAGTILGLAIAGRVEVRTGARNMVLIGLGAMAVALPLGSWLLLARFDGVAYAVLTLVGVGFGLADVAVNVSGARAERASGASRMSMLHAGFSIGGIASVLTGAWAEAARLDVVLHHLIVAVVVIAIMLIIVRWIIEQPEDRGDVTGPIFTQPEVGGGVKARGRGGRASVWRDPRVILLGFIALAGSLADGVATDWMPLAFIDVYALQNSQAVLVLFLFYLGALTLRFTGDRIVQRFGRVRSLRFSFGCAIVGVLLVTLSPWAWLAIPGALLWGAGDALSFPIAVTAAAEQRKNAAKRVAAVSTIAYSGYVAGPVTFGFLGDFFGFRVAFAVLAVILTVSWFMSNRVDRQPEVRVPI